MDHFQEAGRSLCETLLDYTLPNPAQRGSFFRGKSNVSRETSFQIGVSSVISSSQFKTDVYSNAEIYVDASPPAPATIKFAGETADTGIRGADEFSEADDLASDDSDVGFESTKKHIDCVLNTSMTQEDTASRKITNTRKRMSKANTTARTSLDTEALPQGPMPQSASGNFMPLPSTNPSQRNNRARRSRPPLLVSNARPPIKLPQPSGSRSRQGGTRTKP